MGMNGSKGRARILKAIRREKVARAKAAGVDVTDRATFAAWEQADFDALIQRLRGE